MSINLLKALQRQCRVFVSELLLNKAEMILIYKEYIIELIPQYHDANRRIHLHEEDSQCPSDLLPGSAVQEDCQLLLSKDVNQRCAS